MLRVDANNIKKFMTQYKTEIVKNLLVYIPPMIMKNTDDATALLNRILQGAQKNQCFNHTFGHRNRKSSIDNSDIDAFTRFILSNAGKITLKKAIFEPHAAIDKTGHIKPFKIEVPQIMISWQVLATNKLQCQIHYVEGDQEILQTWS